MSNVKNAESYSRLVDICTGYGGKYNPGSPTLQLKAMRALLKEAQSSLQDVSLKRNAYNSITNERAKAFANLDIMANRIIGILISSQIAKATIEDARYFSRLIAGKLATPRLPVPSEDSEEQTTRTRSYTQLSYVAKASNFYKLAQMVGNVPLYTPNEPELQVPVLVDQAVHLQKLNEEVHKAKVALTQARLNRDRIMYKGNDALVNNGSAVKRYAKVVFGTQSGEAAQLSQVRFKKPFIR